jgi:hypothetical protein
MLSIAAIESLCAPPFNGWKHDSLILSDSDVLSMKIFLTYCSQALVSVIALPQCNDGPPELARVPSIEMARHKK